MQPIIVGSSPTVSTMNRRRFIGSLIATVSFPKLPIITEKRNLDKVWTCEVDPNIVSLGNEDIELSLMKAMSMELQREIDKEIVNKLLSACKGVVVELEYTADLESAAERIEGSTPSYPT